MSDVYRAYDLRLKRKVALKLLAPDLAKDERFRERFLRESELAASIDHPNVIPIYEAGEANGLLYIAMRYVEGTELRKRLDAEAKLQPRDALSLLSPVADALDVAHARGLVHRDVKPGNILLAEGDAGEHVYLSDFGLTKRTKEEGSLTETGQFVGTIDYVAPEQIEGREVDGRADVYSLGCVLYECLTGEVPYRSDSKMGVLWSHLQTAAPKPSEKDPALPAQLDPMIAKALAKKPEERHSSCRSLLEEARSALALSEELVAPPAPPPRSQRRLAALALAVLLAVAAAAIVATLMLTGGSADPEGRTAAPVPATDSLVRIDPESGQPIAVIEVGKNPRRVAVDESSVWVTSPNDRTVSRVDPETNEVTRTVTARGIPLDVALGGGSTWVSSSQDQTGWVTALNPTTGNTRSSISIDYSDPVAITVGEEAVWVAASDLSGNAVLRIDPASRSLVATIPLPAKPTDIAAGQGGVWVIAGGLAESVGTPGKAQVFRIDPGRNTIAETIETDGTDIAVGAGSVWAADRSNDTLGGEDVVSRIDPATDKVTAEIVVGAGHGTYGRLAAVDGSVWVGNFYEGSISEIDAATGEVIASVPLGERGDGNVPRTPPSDVAVGHGSVWVTIGTA